MAIYNSTEEFYAQLQKDIINQLQNIAIEIQKDIRLYWLQNVYNIPTKVYERTEMLLNSCVVSPVQNTNGELYIEIYIDNETLHKNPSWYDLPELGIEKGDDMTLEEVTEKFAIMGKDAIGTISEEWTSAGKFINEMMKFLRSKYDILG